MRQEIALRYNDRQTGRRIVTQGDFTETYQKAFAHIDIMLGLGHTNVQVVHREVPDWEVVN